jgi:nitrite reductase (NO-forming)
VVFTVVNKGKISHDFKIAGKKIPNLLPGKSAKLTVKFTKKGHYAYLCTIPGHAGAGMKGTFSVATAAVAPPPSSTPTTTTTPAPTTTSTVPVGNASTTVQVNMVEYAFQLSQSSIPSGQVTFVIKNSGNEIHNFAILGNKAGAQIGPGKSETWTVALAPGTYNYICDVPFHAERGMTGQFTVTP